MALADREAALATEVAAAGRAAVGQGRWLLPGAIAGCVLAAEAAVGYVALGLLLNLGGPGGSPGAFAAPALYATSFGARRLATRAGMRDHALAGVGALLGTVAALLTVKLARYGGVALSDPAWLAALGQELTWLLTAFPFGLALLCAAVLIWWRGWLLAGQPATFRTTAASFQLSATLLLVVYGLAAVLTVPVTGAMPATVVFFCAGLLGVALANWQAVAGQQPGRRDHQWVWLLTGSVLLALAAGALVGFFLDAETLRRLWEAILWLGGLLGAILNYLLHLLPLSEQVEPLPEAERLAGASGAGGDVTLRLELPEWLSNTLRIAWGFTWIALLSMAAYSILSEVVQRLFRRAATPGNATVESLSGGWLDDLRALVRALLRVFEDCQWLIHRWRRQRMPAPSPAIGAVRDAYRGLLYWAAKRGVPRGRAETPYEYLRRLQAALLASAADRRRKGRGPETVAHDLATLTESYVLARYNPGQVGADEQRAAEESWRRLRRSLRR